MVSKPISMSNVWVRENYMLDSRPMNTNDGLYVSACKSIVNNKAIDLVKENVTRYFKSCANKKNANRDFGKCLSLLEALYENNTYYSIYNEMVDMVKLSVLPYCEDTMMVKDTIEKYNGFYTNLKTANMINECVDRVLNNHKKISNRFNVNTLFEKKVLDLECAVIGLCEMIDTYSMTPTAKMEVAIEESLYQFERNSIVFDEQMLIETISDYFLSREENTKVELESGYANILKKCRFISESACDNVKYLIQENNPIHINSYMFDIKSILESSAEDSIKKLLDDYKKEEAKSESKMKQVLNKIFTKDLNLVVDDMPDIFKWVRRFGVLLATTVSLPTGLVALITDSFLKSNLEKDRMDKVIKYFNAEKNKMEDKLYSTESESKQETIQNYIDALEKAIENLKKYEATLYTDSQYMDKEMEDDSFDESYNSKNFDKVVLNNLITDSQEAAEFISKVGDRILHDQKAKKTEIKDSIDESSYEKYISDNGRIDFVLASYDITDVDDMYSFAESVDVLCSTLNNMIYNKSGRIYGILGENFLDLCFASRFTINLTMNESVRITDITDSNLIRAHKVVETANKLENLYYSPLRDVLDFIGNESKVISLDQNRLETILEVWSTYGVPIDESVMKTACDAWGCVSIESNNYIAECEIRNKYNSEYNKYNSVSTIDEQIEGANIINDLILNEKVDLNTLKLAMMSFKKKAKDFNAKQKEISRDLDASFNHLIKSIKSLYTVDHREQIIKGQVAPSLSRIMKIGIALAGVGIATGGIVVPAIAAVAGIAHSKHTSYKEKKLILDEIDIELKVIDRELKMVEDGGKGSTKKYRQLLSWQKNLQNERARILYGIKRSGKVVPSSATKKGDD